MTKLSAVKVKALSKPGRYGDGGGLWLQVRDADRKSWLFRYKLHGKARQMGLGPFPDVPLGDARDAAASCRRLVREGVDPIDRRVEQRIEARNKVNAFTFRQAAKLYINSHKAGWRSPSQERIWRTSLETYAYPVFGDRVTHAVDTDAVKRALDPIWRTKTETATRLRGRIEAVLDYAKAQGWRSGDNPARWSGHLANLLPAPRKVARVTHFPALPYDQVPQFMSALRAMGGTAALAMQFVILTACRTGEAIGATWREIDATAAVWTVPGERMKAGLEHRVPLSAATIAILDQLSPLNTGPASPVFPGESKRKASLSNMALLALLRRMGKTDITTHGFRSSFRDWAAEQTPYPRELVEKALAHTLKDKSEAAYQRSDLLKRRAALMTDWAAYCAAGSRAQYLFSRAKGKNHRGHRG